MTGYSAALPGGFPSSLRMRILSLRDLLTGSGLNHLMPTLMPCLGTGLPLSGRNVEFPADTYLPADPCFSSPSWEICCVLIQEPWQQRWESPEPLAGGSLFLIHQKEKLKPTERLGLPRGHDRAQPASLQPQSPNLQKGGDELSELQVPSSSELLSTTGPSLLSLAQTPAPAVSSTCSPGQITWPL